MAQAEAIIDAGVQSFMHWMELRSPVGSAGGVVPLIQQINAQTDEWRAAEIARRQKALGQMARMWTPCWRPLSRGLARRCCTAPWPSCAPATPTRGPRRRQTVSRLFLRSQSKTGL